VSDKYRRSAVQRLTTSAVAIGFAVVGMWMCQDALAGVPRGHPPLKKRGGHGKAFYRHWAVQATLGHSQHLTAPFDLGDPTAPADLSASAVSEDGQLRLTLKRYMPHARITPLGKPDPSGKAGPAVEILMSVVGQAMPRWLAADDPQYNELPSPAAMTYVRLSEGRTIDDEIQYLKQLASSEPTLIVRDPSGRDRPVAHTIAPGKALDLLGGKLKLRIKRLLTDYHMDPKTGQPVNRSDKPRNPAVVVEAEANGKSQQAILFARYPGFSRNATHAGRTLVFRWHMPKPHMGLGQMTLVDRADGPLTLLIARGGKVQRLAVKAGETTPIAGQNVTLKLVRRLPSARIEVKAENVSNALRRPTVQVQIAQGDEPVETVWITARRPVARRTSKGVLQLRLGIRRVKPPNSKKDGKQGAPH
jgi:hypothetical protein